MFAQVKAVEKAATAVGHSDLDEEEVQWENRIVKPCERENAILQIQVWAPNFPNPSGAGIQYR